MQVNIFFDHQLVLKIVFERTVFAGIIGLVCVFVMKCFVNEPKITGQRSWKIYLDKVKFTFQEVTLHDSYLTGDLHFEKKHQVFLEIIYFLKTKTWISQLADHFFFTA